jgi:hypothetical protein
LEAYQGLSNISELGWCLSKWSTYLLLKTLDLLDKIFSGTKIPAYLVSPLKTKKKSFIALTTKSSIIAFNFRFGEKKIMNSNELSEVKKGLELRVKVFKK